MTANDAVTRRQRSGAASGDARAELRQADPPSLRTPVIAAPSVWGHVVPVEGRRDQPARGAMT